MDYESKASYSITISVTDGEDASGDPETTATIDDTVAVTINVTDHRGRRRGRTVQSHAIRGNCNNRHSHRLLTAA